MGKAASYLAFFLDEGDVASQRCKAGGNNGGLKRLRRRPLRDIWVEKIALFSTT
ncbi:hypothetical protein ATPR_3097 [Acetobacter tropicalis NBRC 101654]|uniref:Uncharacterized protein n=1 Tax=Acetobacter tropicalis NBRC 101654 TaxID=749388 RepID=F7VI98_9PROT|nr:hypothetical protein ATPR_3097 [Acetobacter tropicalis NBRC 101654]